MAKKKESKTKLERSYNIPLRKSFRRTAKHKRTPRAVRTIREFLKKHMKAENIRLGMHLNEHLWKHGIKNPPHHVKVHATKEDEFVNAELEGFEFKEAVKAVPKKKEPATMKDKLASKLGVREGAEESEKPEGKKAEDKKPETKKETKEEAKEETKREKPEPKKEPEKEEANKEEKESKK